MTFQKNINESIGEVIRKYREGRGYTQDEFANLCGISRAYYGRIERGEYNVTVKLCHKIATALGIRIYDLFSDLPE